MATEPQGAIEISLEAIEPAEEGVLMAGRNTIERRIYRAAEDVYWSMDL